MGRKQASAVPPNLIAGAFCNSLVLRNNAPHTSGSNRSRGTPFFRLLMDVFPLTSACRPLTLRRLSVTFHQATLPINAFYFILLNNYYVVVIPQFFLHCNAFLCFSTIFFMLSFHHPDPAHCTHPYQPKKSEKVWVTVLTEAKFRGKSEKNADFFGKAAWIRMVSHFF